MDLTNFIEAGKVNFAKANERRKAEAAERNKAKADLAEYKKKVAELKRLLVLLKKHARRIEKLKLENQHGISIGDYYRCKKKNQVACGPCKTIAALYRKAQVAKDPDKFNKQKRESAKRNGTPNGSRDRALAKGLKSEYYTRKHIIDRDGLDCHICNLPVDLSANHIQGQPNWENYPHIDHVVPIALGGDDILDNVKLAHAKCNLDKGFRLLPS